MDQTTHRLAYAHLTGVQKEGPPFLAASLAAQHVAEGGHNVKPASDPAPIKVKVVKFEGGKDWPWP